MICNKAKCRNAWKTGLGFGKFADSSADASSAKSSQVAPDFIDLKPAGKAARPWFIVAGPPLTPSQFHCATLPGTAMDDVKRIEAKNRAALKAAEQAEIEASGEFTDPDWREVISPDGVRCFVTRFAPPQKPPQQALPPIPDDLSIPDFLRRDAA